MTEFSIEGSPSADHKRRLQSWLDAVTRTCQDLGIGIDTIAGELYLVDMRRHTVVGVDFLGIISTTEGQTLDAANSILDGAWPVDTPTGVIEQRTRDEG